MALKKKITSMSSVQLNPELILKIRNMKKEKKLFLSKQIYTDTGKDKYKKKQNIIKNLF